MVTLYVKCCYDNCTMSKGLQLAIGIALMILAIAISYYLVVLLPKQQQDQLNYQRQRDAAAAQQAKDAAANAAYQNCLKNPPASNTGNLLLDNYRASCEGLKP